MIAYPGVDCLSSNPGKPWTGCLRNLALRL